MICAYECQGWGCLTTESSRPKTVQPTFDATKREQLRTLLHRRPREFGKARSIWTVPLLAEVEAQRITVKRCLTDKTTKLKGCSGQ